jgi:hypothetical protein
MSIPCKKTDKINEKVKCRVKISPGRRLTAVCTSLALNP